MDSFTAMLSAALAYRLPDRFCARDGIRSLLAAATLIALLVVLLECAG